MIARVAALLLLLLPGVAEAQFSLDVTQVAVGSPQGDDPAYPGVCAREACRATIPLLLRDDDLCVLNLQVAAPRRDGWGQIWLALGPCRSGRTRTIAEFASSAHYHLDRLGATSVALVLPIEPPRRESGGGYDDGVVHADVTVRLDIIATTRP
jgi:hypothetical protein